MLPIIGFYAGDRELFSYRWNYAFSFTGTQIAL
jgi:hypothetical protein